MRNLAGRWIVLLLVLGAVALPARADDDDGGGSGAGAGGGASGGADGGADRSASVPSGAPSTGRPLQDLRGFLGLGAPPPPPAPPRPPSPRPARTTTTARLEAEPRELAVIGLDPAARTRLEAAGFAVLEETAGDLLPGIVARLRMPAGVPADTARDRARQLAPAARVDLNHLYRPGQAATRPAHGAAPQVWPVVVAAPRPGCAIPVVGMIDTGIDPASPAVADTRIDAVTRRGAGRAASSTTHGTAIAALLAARLGGAPIVAVDAFHRRAEGDTADAFDIAAALGLMVQRQVRVVNLSFAGPANEVLAVATERAAARGLTMAAAMGNDGPNSPPRFPAAYPWVVAVTAVDQASRPFIRAGRGSHLAFAAPGVALSLPAGGAALSGTSYAVPFVVAAFAHALRDLAPEAALARLAGAAQDLGAPGRDVIFGWGLLRPLPACTGPAAAPAG
jgi:hypothetical protein